MTAITVSVWCSFSFHLLIDRINKTCLCWHSSGAQGSLSWYVPKFPSTDRDVLLTFYLRLMPPHMNFMIRPNALAPLFYESTASAGVTSLEVQHPYRGKDPPKRCIRFVFFFVYFMISSFSSCFQSHDPQSQ
jgi:hypothetical protein